MYYNDMRLNNHVFFDTSGDDSHKHHALLSNRMPIFVSGLQKPKECTVSLKWTNKVILGVRLLPATVSASQVNCGCLRTSLNTLWLLFCSNAWKNPPPAPCSPHSSSTYPTPDIAEAWKSV